MLSSRREGYASLCLGSAAGNPFLELIILHTHYFYYYYYYKETVALLLPSENVQLLEY